MASSMFVDDRDLRVAIDGSVSICVDGFQCHSLLAMKSRVLIGPSVRLRLLCAHNGDVGPIFRLLT